ncbi:MAG: TIGR04283 family arsenosugar biosynthesis glycosyltransferase [bacterium]
MTRDDTANGGANRPLLSIIIPALDEERSIGATLRALDGVRGAEVIVADGGSQDKTRAIAAAHAGVRCVECTRGRAAQMNAGAAAARGDLLLFLHADSLLSAAAATRLVAVMPERPESPGGAFRFALDSHRARYRLIEFGVALRTQVFHLPYGDQGIFARRAAFGALGGFRELPYGEDVDFILRLRRLGPITISRDRVVTSARRWERDGFLRTTLRNWRDLARLATLPSLREVARSPRRTGPHDSAAEWERERSRAPHHPRATP